jgi:maltoporin
MIVAVIVAVAISSGCVEKSGVEVDDVVLDQVRGYADPVTEQILVAMNEDDYAMYSEDFDQTMKNAMTEAVFNEANAGIRSKIGDYVSKEFWKAESKDQYTIAHYKAKFTDEPDDVTVKVVFQEINGEMKVSGLWLDSPKLRKP